MLGGGGGYVEKLFFYISSVTFASKLAVFECQYHKKYEGLSINPIAQLPIEFLFSLVYERRAWVRFYISLYHEKTDAI